MKENKYMLNTLLAAVVGLFLLVCIFVRTFAPAVILPKLDIPMMVLLSLAALVLNYYLAPKAGRNYLWMVALSALTFGLLPYAAGMVTLTDAVLTGVAGCAAFLVTALLYTSIQDRLSTGPAAKAAPILSAFGLYLAVQCFAGVLL